MNTSINTHENIFGWLANQLWLIYKTPEQICLQYFKQLKIIKKNIWQKLEPNPYHLVYIPSLENMPLHDSN